MYAGRCRDRVAAVSDAWDRYRERLIGSIRVKGLENVSYRNQQELTGSAGGRARHERFAFHDLSGLTCRLSVGSGCRKSRSLPRGYYGISDLAPAFHEMHRPCDAADLGEHRQDLFEE